MINQHYQSSIARRKVSSQTEKRELFKKEKARAKKKKSRNAMCLEVSIASAKESLESGDDASSESESSARLTRSTSLHNALRSSPRASQGLQGLQGLQHRTASSGFSRNSSCSQDETSDCDSVSGSSFEGSSCSDEPADSSNPDADAEAMYANATARVKATSSSTREQAIHKSNTSVLSGWVLALLALCGALLAFFSVRF